MDKSDNLKFIASEISAFLKKYATNREKLIIPDYEYEVKEITDIEINLDKISFINRQAVQFTATCKVHRVDSASKVGTSMPSEINGIANYYLDSDKQDYLFDIKILTLKYKTNL